MYHLRRLAVFPYLPALDFVCTCCEKVDQLDGSETSGDNLVYGTLGSCLHNPHASEAMLAMDMMLC